MQLIKLPYCRCIKDKDPVPVSIDYDNSFTRERLDSFVPLVCTRCHSRHYVALGNPICPVPDGTAQKVVNDLLNLNKQAKRRPNFFVTDWREGLTHGEFGARSITLTFRCLKHPGYSIDFSWVEDAKDPTSKAKPISLDQANVETMPLMFAEVVDLLSELGLEPTQRGGHRREWLYLDSCRKSLSKVHTFRVCLSWATNP